MGARDRLWEGVCAKKMQRSKRFFWKAIAILFFNFIVFSAHAQLSPADQQVLEVYGFLPWDERDGFPDPNFWPFGVAYCEIASSQEGCTTNNCIIASDIIQASNNCVTDQLGFSSAFRSDLGVDSTGSAPPVTPLKDFIDLPYSQTIPHCSPFFVDQYGTRVIICNLYTARPQYPKLIDPNPDLLVGPNQITTDLTAIADLSKGRQFGAVIADGVSQLIIRIRAQSLGEQFSLNISSDHCADPTTADCIDNYGFLFDPSTLPTDLFSNTPTPNQTPIVTAVNTAIGPMAFAVYRAPVNFSNSETGDLNYDGVSRSVYIDVNSLQNGPRRGAVVTVTQPPPPPPTLIDPVSEFLDGPQITKVIEQDPNIPDQPFLADVSKGREVQGVATDGVAQVIIRIPAKAVGEQFSLSMKDGQCGSDLEPSINACIDDYGFLFDPSQPTSNLFSNAPSPLQTPLVTAVPTDNGPMAFAAYRAPVDFVRSHAPPDANDSEAPQRSVFISINSIPNGVQPDLEIKLVRPPVMYIHGFTSMPSVWANFTPLITNNNFTHYLLSYDQNIDSRVQETTPSYPKFRKIYPLNSSVVSVDWNSHNIIKELRTYLGRYSSSTASYFAYDKNQPHNSPFPVASIQADIVAHSMGGLIARNTRYLKSFGASGNYGRGLIHKLITIGTPHLGSHNATLILNGTNNCVRDNQPFSGLLDTNRAGYPLESLVIDGQSITGAVADLSTNSDLVKKLMKKPPGSLPKLRVSMIAGQGTSDQFDAINGSTAQNTILAACGTFESPFFTRSGDFLADNFTGFRWPNVFNGAPSDAFVAVSSALNGMTTDSYGAQIVPAVHGVGTVNELKFGSPHLLENASTVPNRVLGILNANITDNSKFIDFVELQ
jgi:hypothetical protein